MRLVLLVPFLFLAFLLTGCVNQNDFLNNTKDSPSGMGGISGPRAQDNGIGSSPDSNLDSGDSSSNDGPVFDGNGPTSAPSDEDIEAQSEELRKKALDYINQVLNDPGATSKAILEALAQGITIGVVEEGDELYEKCVEKIRSRLLSALSDSKLCKNELLEIASLANTIGLDDIFDQATKRAEQNNEYCVEYSHQYKKDEYYGETLPQATSLLTVRIVGSLKEKTLYGYVDPESRTYYVVEGILTWSYSDTHQSDCVTVRETGVGSIPLKDGVYGSDVSINVNGAYAGTLASRVGEVKVVETLVPPDPNFPELCDDVTPRTYTREFPLTFFINGTTSADSYFISDSENRKWTPDDENGDGTGGFLDSSWTIRIPRPL